MTQSLADSPPRIRSGFAGGNVNIYDYVWQNPLSYRDPFGLDGWGNDFADWGDRQIDRLGRRLLSDPDAVNFNTVVYYGMNVYRGYANLFRLGSGVGRAIFDPCDPDPFGGILADIGRASSITLLVAGPAAGVLRGGGSPALAGGRTVGIEPMTDALLKTGSIRQVAGYEVAGNAGLVGETYNINIWGLYATENSQGLASLVNTLRTEARAAGASSISITGNAVRNPAIQNLNPALAGHFGLEVTHVNSTTIVLRGSVP